MGSGQLRDEPALRGKSLTKTEQSTTRNELSPNYNEKQLHPQHKKRTGDL